VRSGRRATVLTGEHGRQPYVCPDLPIRRGTTFNSLVQVRDRFAALEASYNSPDHLTKSPLAPT